MAQAGYKNAFNCKKCPQSNGPDGCPVWAEIVWTEIQTGEIDTRKNCGFQMQNQILVEVLKASNRPAAEVATMRNDLIAQFQKMGNAMKALALEYANRNSKTLEGK